MLKDLYSVLLVLCCSLLTAQPYNENFELTLPGAYATSNAVTGWTVESATNGTPAVACTGTLNWAPGSPEFSIVATPVIGLPWISGPFSIDNQNISASPAGGNRIARLQNSSVGNLATRLRTTFTVSPSNALLQYAFCGSWEGNGHVCCDQPFFQVKVYDCSGALVSCSSLSIIPSGLGGCPQGSGGGYNVTNGVTWTNWQTKYVDLTTLIGSCATIEVINSDCNCGLHHGTAYFDSQFFASVNCFQCLMSGSLPKNSFCAGSNQAILNGPVGFASYQWYAPGSPPVPIGPGFGGNTTAATVTNPIAGTIYTLQMVSPGGCLRTLIDTLQYTTVSILGIGSNSSCAGGASGSASVQGSGSGTGYNYAWYGPGSPAVIGTASTISNVAPGVYTVGVSAIGSVGCGSAVVTITVGIRPLNIFMLNKSFCGNTAYLSGLLPGSNFRWYNGNTLIPAIQGGTVATYTASPAVNGATYRLRYQTNQGCQDSVIFILNQIPGGNFYATANQMICPGASNGMAILSLSTAVSNPPVLNSLSVYTMPGLITYSSITSPSPATTYTLNNLAAGSYSVNAFDGDCLYGTSFFITAITNSFTIVPPSATLCPGNSLFANVSINPVLQPQYAYTWTPNQLLSGNIANGPAAVISPSSVPSGAVGTIIYTVIVTPTLINCPFSQTLAITSINFPTPTISAIPTFCQNDAVYPILVNPAGGTFFNSTGNSINPTGLLTPSLASSGLNTFRYSQMPGTCADYPFSFSINPVPLLAVSGNTTVCSGKSVTLTVSGTDTYSWSINSTSPGIIITPSITSVYSVSGTNTLTGCSGTKTISIVVKPSPTLSVQGNTVICAGGSTQLTAGGALGYNWNTNSTNPSVTISPIVSTTYVVTGDNGNGCSDTRTVTVMVSICTGIEGGRLMDNDIKVYPNPVKSELFLELKSATTLVLFDELGRIIFETSLACGKQVLNMSSYSKGVYLLKASNAEGIKMIRLVKTDQ